jgi:hypothetical protein
VEVKRDAVRVIRVEIESLLGEFPQLAAEVRQLRHHYDLQTDTADYRVADIKAYLESVIELLKTRLDR